MIHSIETRWIDYENDDIYSISTLLDPRFKEVSFSASALDRAKKLLLTLMRRVNADEAHRSTGNETCVICDNEDVQAGSAEKKSLWDNFEEELKKRKASYQLATQHNKDEHKCDPICQNPT